MQIQISWLLQKPTDLDLHCLQRQGISGLSRTRVKSQHKSKKLLVHVLGDFNFREIVWPARLSKCGTMLSQSKGQMLPDIMDDHGLEQMIHFPTHDNKTPCTWFLPLYRVNFRIFTLQTNLVITTLFQDFLKIFIPHIKKPWREVFSYWRGDFETIRMC